MGIGLIIYGQNEFGGACSTRTFSESAVAVNGLVVFLLPVMGFGGPVVGKSEELIAHSERLRFLEQFLGFFHRPGIDQLNAPVVGHFLMRSAQLRISRIGFPQGFECLWIVLFVDVVIGQQGVDLSLFLLVR